MKPAARHNNQTFGNTIGAKEQLQLKAQRNKHSVWSGFGLFGMVGWSVAVPLLLGVAIGTWLDKKYPQHFSWVLTCLLAGLMLGCIIAWQWISKENNKIHTNDE